MCKQRELQPHGTKISQIAIPTRNIFRERSRIGYLTDERGSDSMSGFKKSTMTKVMKTDIPLIQRASEKFSLSTPLLHILAVLGTLEPSLSTV